MARKASKEEKIGVIYARFSSHNQREESIEQQIAEAQIYAKNNGIKIIEIYTDSAKTGRKDTRKDYQRLIRDAKKNRFNYIVAYKSSRLARNMLMSLVLENDMDKLGITICYVKEEFGDNAAGRFALRTMMNVNQFYSENMAEDIKRNQLYNAQQCKANGPAPYGYTADEEGKFVTVPDQAAIVKEIFTRVAEREALVEIYEDLNNRGVKTRRGGSWSKTSLYHILHNERYTGVYIFEDVRIEGGMPSIITKELYYKVQEVLKTKKNPQGRRRETVDYLLTGKLFCGECKSHMIGMSGTARNGSKHYYYACAHKRAGGDCNKKAVQKEYIEEKIAKGIKDYILRQDVVEWIGDCVEMYQKTLKEESGAYRLETELKEVKKAISNILDAIEQGIFTSATKGRLEELEAKEKALSVQIATSVPQYLNVKKTDVIAWLDSFKNEDVSSKKGQERLIKSFLTKAYLYDDKIHIVTDLFGGATQDIDIAIEELEKHAENAPSVCSTKVLIGSPIEYNPNTLFFVGIVFGCTTKHRVEI